MDHEQYFDTYIFIVSVKKQVEFNVLYDING